MAREAFKLRAELVERSFALVLDRGGMRRAWLRGRENLRKRYLVHVAGYNLGLIMRLLVGAGTPREFLARASAHLLALATADGAALAILAVATDTEAAMLVVSFEPEPTEAGFFNALIGPGNRSGQSCRANGASSARQRARLRHGAATAAAAEACAGCQEPQRNALMPSRIKVVATSA